MRIALLGELELRDDDGVLVEIAGVRLRRLLARLVLAGGRPVSAEGLVGAVWGDEPPSGATNALQSLISRLRRALPAEDVVRLELAPGGYRLRTVEGTVDTERFEKLAAEGRVARESGDLPMAARRFAEALRLWRGPPLAELGAVDFAEAAAARLTELRLRTVEDRAEVELALGEPDETIAELEGLIRAQPLRERPRELHIRALYAAGRAAEALGAYQDLRRTLAERLGSDPSPPVRALHLAILRGAADPAGPPPSRRTNLRTALTSFVGREEELERVGKLLAEARLVTLVGPGGAGKSRLAAEIAAGIAARRTASVRDGVWLVELAGVRDPRQIPATVSAALGLYESGLLHSGPATAGPEAERAREPVGRLAEALRERRLLIVLDNCEHLIDACAELAEAVVSRCPQVRVLATSREPLAIGGEVLHTVAPLRVPSPGTDFATASGFPVLRLFADRAAAVRPGFALTMENLPVVAEVCRRLDGLPLAIELACARLRSLPVEEIAARLGNRFRLLTGGSRTALPRHQTLLAVVEWSWELFGEAERVLARRLAVFAGGATLASVEAVCSDARGGPLTEGIAPLRAEDVLQALGSLVDKSFVELLETPGALPRYQMLDTIRAYAAGVLTESGEAEPVRRAHAAYFTQCAETAEPALRGPEQLRRLEWLAREYGNLTTALRWAVDTADTQTAVRLTAALGWFWNIRSAHDEAATWLRESLALPGADPTGRGESLATAYAYDAMHNFALQQTERALRSASIARGLADDMKAGQPAVALMNVLSKLHPVHTDSDRDAALLQLAELSSHPDPWLAAAARLFHGFASAAFGSAAEAAAHLTAARDAFAAVGDRWGMAAAVGSLGSCHSINGDHATAIAAMTEAVRFMRTLGSDSDAAWMLVERGMELLRADDLTAARADFDEVKAGEAARRSPMALAFADIGLGELARRSGDLARARSVLTGVLARSSEAEPNPAQTRTLALIALGRAATEDGDLAAARAHLGEGLRRTLAVGERSVIAGAAEALADLAIVEGESREAARLLGLATSRNSTRGRPIRLAARSSRRRMPPE
ncbi:BTAD domain-containing putative transcriptional regulator [Nonomuraea sp. NPDC026600]|uniref:BTAD domain-containing putative transcriptional regulator n=1 Tax=Nonomuraea sp. NPDC026600 TaxID=3155363 RepID=UPI0033D03787